MAYDNTNSGILARNENRKTDNHPEFSGSLNVEGVDYWVSAWINEGKAGGKMEGKKYFSIKINRKEQQAGGSPRKITTPESFYADKYDGDIPF